MEPVEHGWRFSNSSAGGLLLYFCLFATSRTETLGVVVVEVEDGKTVFEESGTPSGGWLSCVFAIVDCERPGRPTVWRRPGWLAGSLARSVSFGP